MKGGRSLIVAGSVVLVFGAIFHLQGQSIVGPETSFMYANPEWVTYGIQIVIIGAILIGIGIAVSRIKRT